MSQPSITLHYNNTSSDIPYDPTSSGVYIPVVSTVSGTTYSGTIVFTGGGIDEVREGDPIGTRSATVRPESGSLVVPTTFVEQEVMHQVPLAGIHNHRYVFAVQVDGSTTSDVYLEAWDDLTHTTTDLPVLAGTASNSNESMVHAISTTGSYPGDFWVGTRIRGYGSRIGLYGSTSMTDVILYFNIYVEIPFDSPTFINTPILSLRYLYS